MKKAILALLALIFASAGAFAQSTPNLTYGQVPTAGQWNNFFAQKQDYLGYTPVNRAGDTMFGPLKMFAPTGTQAGLIVTPGQVPTAPVDGSIWFTGSGMYMRVNGATIGPIANAAVGGPATSVVGHLASWNNTTGSLLADSGKVSPTGAIVGTTDTQTLTNKSISGAQINSGTIAVANGGTGISSGTSGGILYFSGTGAIASSGLLTNHAIMLGAGAAAAPTALGSLGTTTTVLHGNAAGGPSFGAVALGSDVSGTLPEANGGTNQTAYATGDTLYATGANTLGKRTIGATGTVYTVAGGVPTWAASVPNLPKRQTILAGPQDSSGLPTFWPSTSGSLVLTMQNVTTTNIQAAIAEGFGQNGGVDVVVIVTTNLAVTLTASNTNFVYLDTTGTLGAVILAPVYIWAGTPSTTSGQCTYIIALAQMFCGNGSTAPAANRVFIGEAVAGASTITSTVMYAYQGYYDSGYIPTIPSTGTLTSLNANLGVTGPSGADMADVIFSVLCTTAANGYSVGDALQNPATSYVSGAHDPFAVGLTGRNVIFFTTGANSALVLPNKTTGASTVQTNANFSYRLTARRKF